MFTLKQSWIAGILASILVWTWEFLLHYSPNVLELGAPFEFLSAVPSQNFAIGHIFVLIGIPLYFIGYYHFYLMLRPASEKIARLFYFLAIVAFLYWGIWIATRWYIGTIVQLEWNIAPWVYEVLTERYLYYFDNLLQILRILIFPISWIWIYLILSWKTQYSKFMALLSPVVVLLSVFMTLAIPVIWKFLVPIALNIAHFILFSFSLYFVFKISDGEKS